MKRNKLGLVLVVVVMGGLGYLRLPVAGTPPRIEQFAVSRADVTAGQPVDFSWGLGDAAGQLLSTNLLSTNVEVALEAPPYRTTPTLSDRYTLIAQNRTGTDQQTLLVQVNAQVNAPSGGVGTPSGGAASGGATPDAGLPEGGLGVSLDPAGPFLNDAESDIGSPDDERVVRVVPGGEFFAEVAYTDPDGITQVSILLTNGSPEGLAGSLLPDRPPFEIVGAPTGDCRLGELPTVVRCVFRVRVAEDARNISELPGAGGEFAYVFRSRADDGQGNTVNREVRGYVVVTP